MAAELGWATTMGYGAYVRHHLPHLQRVAIEINTTSPARILMRAGIRISARAYLLGGSLQAKAVHVMYNAQDAPKVKAGAGSLERFRLALQT